jgi:hypothetical protein
LGLAAVIRCAAFEALSSAPTRTKTTLALIDRDAHAGGLYRPQLIWDDVLKTATVLAKTQTRSLGCRSLDILHCAAADSLSASRFVTTDARQRKLALKIGLSCPSV